MLSTTVRARLRDERGSVSIEMALGLSSLVAVLAAMVAALATLGAHLAAIDTAGAAARAHAIGVDFTPPRGSVDVTVTGGLVTVTARIPAPLREMSATAVFPEESP